MHILREAFLFNRHNSTVHTNICNVLRYLVSFVNLKNVKNIHGGVLLLVKFQAKASNFTKNNTPAWAFSCFLNCANGTKPRNQSHISREDFFIQETESYSPCKHIATQNATQKYDAIHLCWKLKWFNEKKHKMRKTIKIKWSKSIQKHYFCKKRTCIINL